jgi:hypothetical protein
MTDVRVLEAGEGLDLYASVIQGSPAEPAPQPTAAALLVRRSCLSLGVAAAAGLG